MLTDLRGEAGGDLTKTEYLARRNDPLIERSLGELRGMFLKPLLDNTR